MLTELDLKIRQEVIAANHAYTKADDILKWWLHNICKRQVGHHVRDKIRYSLIHPLSEFPPTNIYQSTKDQILENISNAN